MKTRSHLIIGLLCIGQTLAATWTVDSNTARPADFRTIKDAHDSVNVASGDTLHLMPSTIGYGPLSLTKRLAIIGPGYLLNQNLTFSVAAPSALTGPITFMPGSDGSLITGCEIVGDVQMLPMGSGFPNNLTIKRNLIQGSVSNSANCPSSNVQILQNHITGAIAMDLAASGGLVIRGNFSTKIDVEHPQNSGVVSYNISTGGLDAGGSCLYENNLIQGKIWGSHTALIRNCWGSNPERWTGTPTFIDCDTWYSEYAYTFAGQFVNTGTLDARWRLRPSALVKGKGYGGTDPGQFAGPDPYVISGLPAVPMVVGIQAPSSASTASGLPITVELQVNP